MNKDVKEISIKKLKELCDIVHGPLQLSRMLGISKQRLNNWFIKGVPIEMVLRLEYISNGKINRYDIRPDIYVKD
jgi:DNA-binding transcriptional regulator YdaS (Cro superfamily)